MNKLNLVLPMKDFDYKCPPVYNKTAAKGQADEYQTTNNVQQDK